MLNLQDEYLEKYENLLELIKCFDCNYCILQNHLFQIVDLLDYKIFDGHNKVFRKYTKDTFNLAIRRLEQENLLERFFMPLPNGTRSKYKIICLKRKAVAYIENIELEKLKGLRKPTSNIRYMKALIKGDILINVIKSNEVIINSDNKRKAFLQQYVFIDFNTLLTKESDVYNIYNNFANAKCNVEANRLMSKNLKANKDLNFKKGSKIKIDNTHNLLTLKKYRHTYLDNHIIANGTFIFNAYITNPTNTKKPKDYIQDLIETHNVIYNLLNNSDKDIFSKFKINIYFCINSNYEIRKIKDYFKTREAESELRANKIYLINGELSNLKKDIIKCSTYNLSILNKYGRVFDK